MAVSFSPPLSPGDYPHHALEQLLGQLEQQLRAAQLWCAQPPALDSIQSELPFACDQISLPLWLQIIFIPRMQQLLTQQQPLPATLCILPVAQTQLCAQRDQAVLAIIAQLDALFAPAVS